MVENKLVVDTSVLVKWFKETDEQGMAEAIAIKIGFQQGAYSIIIPDLAFYELGNVLRWHSRLTPAQAAEKFSDFWLLGLTAQPITVDLGREALGLAYEFEATFYDACFLALAKQNQCGFITADLKFYEKIKELDYARPLQAGERSVKGE